jgi:hypothetical protein
MLAVGYGVEGHMETLVTDGRVLFKEAFCANIHVHFFSSVIRIGSLIARSYTQYQNISPMPIVAFCIVLHCSITPSLAGSTRRNATFRTPK